jgi:PAS domain-containing protein
MGSVLKGSVLKDSVLKGSVVKGNEATLDEAALQEGAAGDAVFSEESAAEEQEAHGHVGQSGFFGRFVDTSGMPSSQRRTLATSALDEVQSLNRALQRANDALHAANVELRAEVEAQRGANLELQHMLDSLDQGVMLLDEELVLLQFNAMAAQFMNLDALDLGNPVTASCRGLGAQLEAWCHEVSRTGRRAEHSCRSAIGEPLCLRIRGARIGGSERLILLFAEASAE